MKTLNELKALKASKITEQENVMQRAENGNLSEDQNNEFDGLQREIEDLNKQIQRAEQYAKNQREAAKVAGEPVNQPKEEKKMERFSFISAIRKAVTGEGLNDLERELQAEAQSELRASGLSSDFDNGIMVPSYMVRAQTVTEDAGAKGGALVSSNPELVLPLNPKLRLADMGADVMSGLIGDIPLPTNEAFTISAVGETTDVTAVDANFAGPILKPKRFAGVVEISKKLINQTSFSVENYVRQQIERAMDNAIMTNAINGAGGVAPTGLYTSIVTNVSAAVAGAPTWVDVVELETMIKTANANETALAYLSDPQLMGKLKTTAKDAGSGLFLADGNGLNGQKYVASTLVPTLDAGVSHPLIYGDWSELKLGFWGGMSFMVDPYTKASAGKVRLIIELFADVAVTNEKAFAIRDNFTV